jgi:hypothetical protein
MRREAVVAGAGRTSLRAVRRNHKVSTSDWTVWAGLMSAKSNTSGRSRGSECGSKDCFFASTFCGSRCSAWRFSYFARARCPLATLPDPFLQKSASLTLHQRKMTPARFLLGPPRSKISISYPSPHGNDSSINSAFNSAYSTFPISPPRGLPRRRDVAEPAYFSFLSFPFLPFPFLSSLRNCSATL